MMRIKSFIWLLFGIIWQGVVPAFAQQGSSGEKIFFYHHDHLGNTVCVTDEAGEVVQHVEYLPTGEVFIEEKNPASTYATSYKFNGKELDEETGLYYYGARYLHPKYGMWLSCDPMEEKYPNVSSYTYCHDNPVMRKDRFGLDDYTINLTTGEIDHLHTKDKTHSFFITDGKSSVKIGSYEYNKYGYLGMSGKVSFYNLKGELSEITFKHGNESEHYMSPEALAALIGATAEVGYTDVVVNHFSNANGSSPAPSKSHKLGRNGDLTLD